MATRLIGLTGNIGCGKSTVAKMLNKFGGVTVCDTDKVWKEIIKDSLCRSYVELLVGPESFVNDEPQFSVIAEAIFADPQKRIALQTFASLHVMCEIMYRAQKSDGVHIVESAILFENNTYKMMEKNIVVTCDKKEQMRRVLAREIPGRAPLTRKQALARMKCQWSQRKKIARADFVIDTNCSIPELERRVAVLYRQIMFVGEYFI